MTGTVKMVIAAGLVVALAAVGVLGWQARADQRDLRGRMASDYAASVARQAQRSTTPPPATDADDLPTSLDGGTGGGTTGAGGSTFGGGSSSGGSGRASGSSSPGSTTSGGGTDTPEAPTTPATGGGSGSSVLDGVPSSPSGGPIQLDDDDVRLLTPLLGISRFGSTAGFLLACNTVGSTLSQVAAELPGTETLIAELVGLLTSSCADISVVAAEQLDILEVALADLKALNPMSEAFYQAVAPLFDALDGLAPHLAPLGTLLTALGPIIAFFIGPAK